MSDGQFMRDQLAQRWSERQFLDAQLKGADLSEVRTHLRSRKPEVDTVFQFRTPEVQGCCQRSIGLSRRRIQGARLFAHLRMPYETLILISYRGSYILHSKAGITFGFRV